jgi:Holliday junction resolvase RusA-like endonuclease
MASQAGQEAKVTITVYGIPKPQPRPRFGNGRAYDSGTSDAWKASVQVAAMPKRPRAAWDCALAVEIDFMLPRPARGKYSEPLGKPDLDNLAKAVLDALTDVGMWTDDSRVVELKVSKRYAEQPGAVITIKEAGR